MATWLNPDTNQNYNYSNPMARFAGDMLGMFNDPYKSEENTSKNYLNQSKDYFKPFYDAGTGAIDRMKDPTSFINSLMSQYQQSPFAKYQTDQATRAATNAASANGMVGSTPFMQQIQQNAGNIASGDMNNWLQMILGMNNNLAQFGSNAAGSMANLNSQFAPGIASDEYGQKADKDFGIGDMISMFL